MSQEKTEHELRCRCSMKVKLAVWGMDTDGRAYLHIRARKNQRIIHNSLHKGGQHELWCTNCHRVTRIYLDPRGSRILPPSAKVSPQLLEGETITLPQAATQK